MTDQDDSYTFSTDPEFLRQVAQTGAEMAVAAVEKLQRERAQEKQAVALSELYQIEYDGLMPRDPWEGVSYDQFHMDDGKGGVTFLRQAAVAFTTSRTHYRKTQGPGLVWHQGVWREKVEGVYADEWVKHLIYKHITDIPQRAGAVHTAVVNKAPIGEPLISKDYIGFLNGDLRLSDGCLVAAKPDHGVWTRVQAVWDQSSECPQLDAYLDRHIVAEDHPMFWAMVADSMKPWLSADALYLILGKRRTGKGTLLAMVQALMGEYAGSIDLASFSQDKFAASNFAGCTTAIDEDTEARYLEGCAALKRLTSSNGREKIEHKGKGAVSRARTATIIAASNDRPVFDDPALAGRLRLIRSRSENSFADREDPQAVSPLLTPAELAGAAYKAVQLGLAPLRAGTSPAFKSNPELIQEIRVQGSSVAAWLQSLLDANYGGAPPPKGTKIRVTNSEFALWCAANREKDMPARKWSAEMDRHLQDFGWTSRLEAHRQWRDAGKKLFESGWDLIA